MKTSVPYVLSYLGIEVGNDWVLTWWKGHQAVRIDRIFTDNIVCLLLHNAPARARASRHIDDMYFRDDQRRSMNIFKHLWTKGAVCQHDQQ